MNKIQNERTAIITAKVTATAGITKTKGISPKMQRDATLLGVLGRQSKYDLVWYSSFLIFGILCIAFFHKDPLIYLTVGQLFSYMIVCNLIARGRVLGIWLNIFDCFLYGAICFINGVYGEMFKTLVISNIFNVYGIISWSKKKNPDNSEVKKNGGEEELAVRRLSPKQIWLIIVIIVLGTVGTYFVLSLVGTTLALLGAIVFVFSVVNKYLSMSRYLESWWVNMLGTMISTAMWVTIIVTNVTKNGDWSTLPILGSYLASLISNINGMVMWNRLYRRATVNGGEYLAMREIHITKIVKVKRKFKRLTWQESRDTKGGENESLKRRIKVATNRGLFH